MRRFRSIMAAAGIVALAASCSSAELDVEARPAPAPVETTVSYLTLDSTFGEWVAQQYAAVVYVHAWDVARGAEYAAAVARAEEAARAAASRRSSSGSGLRPSGGPSTCTGHWVDGRILDKESGCSYDAYNAKGCDGRGCIGLYQLHSDHYTSGQCRGLGTDPAGQEECARRISSDGTNTRPWAQTGG